MKLTSDQVNERVHYAARTLDIDVNVEAYFDLSLADRIEYMKQLEERVRKMLHSN